MSRAPLPDIPAPTGSTLRATFRDARSPDPSSRPVARADPDGKAGEWPDRREQDMRLASRRGRPGTVESAPAGARVWAAAGGSSGERALSGGGEGPGAPAGAGAVR